MAYKLTLSSNLTLLSFISTRTWRTRVASKPSATSWARRSLQTLLSYWSLWSRLSSGTLDSLRSWSTNWTRSTRGTCITLYSRDSSRTLLTWNLSKTSKPLAVQWPEVLTIQVRLFCQHTFSSLHKCCAASSMYGTQADKRMHLSENQVLIPLSHNN